MRARGQDKWGILISDQRGCFEVDSYGSLSRHGKAISFGCFEAGHDVSTMLVLRWMTYTTLERKDGLQRNTTFSL